MYRKQDQTIELFICGLDLLIIFASLFLAGLLRYQSMEIFLQVIDIGLLGSILSVLHIAFFYLLKLYEGFFGRGRYQELFLCIRHNAVLVAGAALLGFFIHQEVFYSRLIMIFFCVINIWLMWFAHLGVRNRARVLRRKSVSERGILLVTSRDKIDAVLNRFHASKEYSWNIVGIIFTENPDGQKDWDGIPVIAPNAEIYLEYATSHVVDEVFVQLDSIQKQEAFLKNMILEFEKMGVTVNLSLDLFDMGLSGEKRICNLEQYNVIAFSSRLFDYRMVLLKRLMDIAGALVGLVITVFVGIFLAPVLLLESPGPLIFKQKRVGMNGRIFEFYKFRSMYADAEERKKELMEQNEMQGLMFKMEDDPRVTKVGAFIRKTSIDELPQFWNVLKGDMSLVGTRPPTLDEYQRYSYYQKRRISFRPGITGLWQISGRSDITDFDEVVKLDLDYIDNWSLLLDIKIIVRTIGVVILGKGAK